MYLYGASGHAMVVIDILKMMGISVAGFFDDDMILTSHCGIEVRHHWSGEAPVIISVGDNMNRKKIANRIRCEYGTAIHPSAIVSPTASLGCGSVVMPGSIINTYVNIGEHCIINTGASIDHGCSIGDFAHISPHATLCGNVEIGEGTWIGAGSVIIPGIKVGRWCTIGAGSIVTRDIPDGVLAYGNPCKIHRKLDIKL